ncbi:MAG: hypothetical protein IJ133_06970 [Clostridia bacterium]|nr:hypothetical protein [Clostridia bacterium]
MDTPLASGTPGATDINPLLDRISVLLVEMERVAAAHGVDASLIPAAWVANKGLIPIGFEPEALKDLILTSEEQKELESLATYLIVAA